MGREPLLPSPLPQSSDLKHPIFLLTIPLAGWDLGPSKPPLQNLDTALGAPEGRGNRRTKANGSTQSVSSCPRLGAPQMCAHTHTHTHTTHPFTPRDTHTQTHTLHSKGHIHTHTHTHTLHSKGILALTPIPSSRSPSSSPPSTRKSLDSVLSRGFWTHPFLCKQCSHTRPGKVLGPPHHLGKHPTLLPSKRKS